MLVSLGVVGGAVVAVYKKLQSSKNKGENTQATNNAAKKTPHKGELTISINVISNSSSDMPKYTKNRKKNKAVFDKEQSEICTPLHNLKE